ncbi:MAG: hypothetical protein SGPRY_002439 [Prymnesium sp.]
MGALPKGRLMEGWEEVRDPSQSRPYYVHSATGETAWVAPAEPSPHVSRARAALEAVEEAQRLALSSASEERAAQQRAQEAVGEVWRAEGEETSARAASEAARRHLSICEEGMERAVAQEESAVGAAVEASSREREASMRARALPGALLVGWEEVSNAWATGSVYYANTESGETVWEKPVASNCAIYSARIANRAWEEASARHGATTEALEEVGREVRAAVTALEKAEQGERASELAVERAVEERRRAEEGVVEAELAAEAAAVAAEAAESRAGSEEGRQGKLEVALAKASQLARMRAVEEAKARAAAGAAVQARAAAEFKVKAAEKWAAVASEKVAKAEAKAAAVAAAAPNPSSPQLSAICQPPAPPSRRVCGEEPPPSAPPLPPKPAKLPPGPSKPVPIYDPMRAARRLRQKEKEKQALLASVEPVFSIKAPPKQFNGNL